MSVLVVQAHVDEALLGWDALWVRYQELLVPNGVPIVGLQFSWVDVVVIWFLFVETPTYLHVGGR